MALSSNRSESVSIDNTGRLSIGGLMDQLMRTVDGTPSVSQSSFDQDVIPEEEEEHSLSVHAKSDRDEAESSYENYAHSDNLDKRIPEIPDHKREPSTSISKNDSNTNNDNTNLNDSFTPDFMNETITPDFNLEIEPETVEFSEPMEIETKKSSPFV
eukprot:UN29269